MQTLPPSITHDKRREGTASLRSKQQTRASLLRDNPMVTRTYHEALVAPWLHIQGIEHQWELETRRVNRRLLGMQ